MGLEDCSDEEFERRIEQSSKKRLKSLVLKAAAIIAGTAGLYALAGYALCRRAEEIKDYAVQETAIMPQEEHIEKHTAEKKQAIEQLVKEVRTPEQAFEKINSEVRFFHEHDAIVNLRRDYWASLQETWERKTGDCDDGAIAFKALLSDNMEYDVRILILKARIQQNHMIAVYRDKTLGLWGYVSFNNLHSNGCMESPLFDSMESAIAGFNNNGEYISCAVIDFTDEELKFGADLTMVVDYLQTTLIMQMMPATFETPLSIEGYL